MPTYFPDFPPLPDPSMPAKRLSDAVEQAKKHGQQIDQARDELVANAQAIKGLIEKALRLPKIPRTGER